MANTPAHFPRAGFAARWLAAAPYRRFSTGWRHPQQRPWSIPAACRLESRLLERSGSMLLTAPASTRRTEGAEGTTVPVAVPVPEGVKYETTVEE